MEFSKYFDHTILNAAATMEEVDRICKEAIEYRFASVCVNGAWTKAVAEKLTDTDIAVCTVIGFPLGAMSTRAKRFETLTAIEDGATEIDMVVNIGAVKDRNDAFVRQDIAAVKEICSNNTMGKEVILKVIIETCLLTDEEIRVACELCTEAGIDWVKSSTGQYAGPTLEQVRLMVQCCEGTKTKVKVSGVKDPRPQNA